MKKALVSIFLIVLVSAGCRSPDPETALTTGPTTVNTVPTTVGNEPSVSATEPTDSLTQAGTVPEYESVTELADSATEKSSPQETAPTQTAPPPTEPAPEPTSPPDTRPAETAPQETQSQETQSAETEPVETGPVETEPVEIETPITDPTQTEVTEPTDCRHEWICIHHNEEGHWIAGIVCDCGWKLHGDPEELVSLWNAHSASFPITESLFDHGGYGCVDEWIVDKPAYDKWVCRHCAEPKP